MKPPDSPYAALNVASVFVYIPVGLTVKDVPSPHSYAFFSLRRIHFELFEFLEEQ
jgi:hypothetical protein